MNYSSLKKIGATIIVASSLFIYAGNAMANVGPLTPIITWVPNNITYGTPLKKGVSNQLNAVATDPNTSAVIPNSQGTLSYTPDVGAILPGGNGQTLSVTFTPKTSTYATTTQTSSINVGKADVVIKGISFSNKVYDGTTVVTATGTPTLQGLYSGDTVSLDTSGLTATFSDPGGRNVGNNKPITVSGLVLTGTPYVGTLADDFNLLPLTPNANITRLDITVSAATDTKVYDGTTVSTGTPVIISSSTIVSGDTAPVWSQSFNNKTAGNGKILTPSGIVNDGNGGANYHVTFATTTGTILQRPITVAAASSTKVYNGNTNSTDVPTVTSGTLISGDSLGFSQSFDTADAGTNKILTPSGNVHDGVGGADYAVTPATTTGIITPKTLTVTGFSVNNKAYDGTTLATTTGTPSLNGVIAADLGNVTLATTTIDASFPDKNIYNNYNINIAPLSLVGSSSPNYSLTQPSKVADITRLHITVYPTVDSKVYDGTTTSSGIPVVSTSTPLAIGDVGTFSQVFGNKNASTTKNLIPSGTIADASSTDMTGNYAINFTTLPIGSISPLPLTVTATSSTKIYDGATTSPSLPDITSGSIVGTDTFGFIESYDTKDIGTAKVLTPSGHVHDGVGGIDYAVTFASTTDGTITAKDLTVSGAVAQDKQYDSTASSTVDFTSAILVGVVGTEDVSLATSSYVATFNDANVGPSKPVTVNGVALAGADKGNYTISQPTGLTANITQASITITAEPNIKIYDGDITASTTPTVSGLQGSTDTVTGLAETYDTKNVGTGKTLSVSAYTVNDGNTGGNYAVSTVSTSTGEIDTRAITVTASANNKVYDGTTTASATPTITSGTLGIGDSAGFIETYKDKNVGTDKTLIPAGIVNDGYSGANYNVTFNKSYNGVITKATLTVSGVTADSKTYDSTTTTTVSGSGSLVSVISPDSVFLVGTSTATFNNKNVGVEKTVTTTGLSLTGDDAVDYSLTQPTLSADITKAPLTITAQTNSKTYDANITASTTPTVSGLQGSTDTVTGLAETYDNANAGTGKTLSVSTYTVNDDNDGGNYAVSAVSTSTGVITQYNISVQADHQSKVYGNPDPSPLTYLVTEGSLQGEDGFSGSLTRDSGENVGSYSINQGSLIAGGNGGNNYNLAFSTSSLDINPRPITITAYDLGKEWGSSDPTLTAHITSGTLAEGDSLTGTPARDTSKNDIGTTSITHGTIDITDGESSAGSNYDITFVKGTFTISDTVPPVITDGTTPGNITAEATEASGTIVTFDLPSATDNHDATTTVSCTPEPGSVFALGTTTVTCSASDISGNHATSTSFDVTVRDTTPPVITLLGSNPVVITAGSIYNDAGVTAIDSVDGDITSHVVASSTVNANVVGAYSVVYTVSDAVGNIATSTRLISVNPAPSSSSGTMTGGGGAGIPSGVAGGGDMNGDGQTDAQDFATLMANWGKTGPNILADLNHDGQVDISDFVILMANWTK